MSSSSVVYNMVVFAFIILISFVDLVLFYSFLVPDHLYFGDIYMRIGLFVLFLSIISIACAGIFMYFILKKDKANFYALLGIRLAAVTKIFMSCFLIQEGLFMNVYAVIIENFMLVVLINMYQIFKH